MPKTVFSPRSRKRALVVVIILISIGIGLYILLSSAKAENFGVSPVLIRVGTEASQDHPADTTFDLPVYGSHGQGGPGQAVLMLSFDRSRVQYLGHTCGTVSPCRSNPTHNGDLPSYRHHVNAFVCFDVPFNGTGVPSEQLLLTVHLKALQHLPGPFNVNWLVLVSGSAPGSCATNRDATGVQWGNGQGGCGGPDIPACDTGSDVGFGPAPVLGPDPNAGVTGPTGNGSGSGTGAGGGSGSTANQQSEVQNSLPSTALQGDQKELEVEPSPFFDGKEFKPGSSVVESVGLIKNGQITLTGWTYILVAVVTVGIAVGAFYWYRVRKQ